MPSTSLSASLLCGGLTAPGLSGVAGIEAATGGPLSTLRTMARATPGEACEGPVCARQVAKALAQATITSTTIRGEATRIA